MTLPQGDVAAIQERVGGYFQCVDIKNPDATLFCDEEGKVKGRELNRRATLLWWTYWSAARHVDFIAGDCLVLGQPDDEGNTRGAPDDLVDLFTIYDQWRYEVQVYGETGYYGNQVVYTDVWEAFNGAQLLADRWSRVEEVRVVPVVQEDEPA